MRLSPNLRQRNNHHFQFLGQIFLQKSPFHNACGGAFCADMDFMKAVRIHTRGKIVLKVSDEALRDEEKRGPISV